MNYINVLPKLVNVLPLYVDKKFDDEKFDDEKIDDEKIDECSGMSGILYLIQLLLYQDKAQDEKLIVTLLKTIRNAMEQMNLLQTTDDLSDEKEGYIILCDEMIQTLKQDNLPVFTKVILELLTCYFDGKYDDTKECIGLKTTFVRFLFTFLNKQPESIYNFRVTHKTLYNLIDYMQYDKWFKDNLTVLLKHKCKFLTDYQTKRGKEIVRFLWESIYSDTSLRTFVSIFRVYIIEIIRIFKGNTVANVAHYTLPIKDYTPTLPYVSPFIQDQPNTWGFRLPRLLWRSSKAGRRNKTRKHKNKKTRRNKNKFKMSNKKNYN